MLMTAAARGIKRVISRVHREVIRDVVVREYNWNMLYDKDESCKGDASVVPMGVLDILMRDEIASKRMEFFQLVSQNEVARRIVGIEGLANLLREAGSSLQMEQEKVVPNADKIKELAAHIAEQEQQALVANAGMPQGAAKQQAGGQA